MDDKTKYKVIAAKINKYIYDQNIPVGSKLPSVREFVKLFDSSVCTVYAALEELKSQGLVEAKPQSGFYISYEGWNSMFNNTPDWHRHIEHGFIKNRAESTEADFYQRSKDLGLSAYNLCGNFGASEYINRAMLNCIENGRMNAAAGDSDYRGTFSLRQAVCDYMRTLGVVCVPGNILITNGIFNAQALTRFAFMRPGSVSYAENFFTSKSNTAYDSLGINRVSLPMDNQGIILDSLKSALHRGRNAFVSSTFGAVNPYADEITHGLSSVEYKHEFLKICNTARVPVIEVDISRSFLPPDAPAPLKAFDNSNSVLYLGSFNKVFYKNFRFGWVVGPKNVIAKLAEVKMQIDGEQNYITQAIAEELFVSGLYTEYIEQFRQKLYETKIAAGRILQNHLGDIAEFNLNSYPPSDFINFHNNIDLRKMYNNRGSFKFLPLYVVDEIYRQSVLLHISNMPLDNFEQAIMQLSKLARKSVRR